ncbi:MAG: choice-of-anchor D domain-containing protein [Acidobacteria bacterium]|nr:MAG: choice-of-anchor D domain-containing protein [Acidobacteriota bacterium]
MLVKRIPRLYILLLAAGTLFPASFSFGQVGTFLGQVTFSAVCGIDKDGNSVGTGITFDGTNLWYSCYDSAHTNSNDLYKANPATGAVIAGYNIDGGLGAIAYDASRNVIWAGEGGGTITNQVIKIPLDANKNVSGPYQVAFTVQEAFCSPPAGCGSDDIVDGLAIDSVNSILYVHEDFATEFASYNASTGSFLGFIQQAPDIPKGTPVIPPHTGANGLCVLSGLAIGGSTFFEASDYCDYVWAVNSTTLSEVTASSFSIASSVPSGFDQKALTCDPNTFPGKNALWVNGAFTTGALAFQIPTGSCGVGGQPALQGIVLSPASLTFSSQNVGSSSAPETVTLTNYQSAALSITGIAITGANGGDYSQTNNCGTSLAAGASCSINVTFTPTAAGTRTASLAVTDNAPASPQTAALSGSGTAPAATLSPTSLTFANQPVGTSSSPQNVTLSNSGTGNLNISSIGVTGDFSQTNNCGSSVAPGSNCTISVTFVPTATGTRTGSLTVSDNATTSPQSDSLTGTGVTATGIPIVGLSLTALAFGKQNVGTTSPSQAITLSNTGNGSLGISGISITGSSSGDYSQTNNCGTGLVAGTSCTINVTFTPTAAGTRTANLTFTDNALNSPQAVTLTGTGAMPSVPAFVQVQNNIDTSGTAFTSFSVNITTQSGDLLVAFCRESSNGTDNFTVTDSAGQVWALTSSGYVNESDTGPRTGMFYIANSAAVTSVTVRYSTAGGVIKPGIMVMELSGASASGVADGSANHASLASATTATSGSLTTTNPSDVLIFAADASGNESSWIAGAGYVIPNNKVNIGANGSNIRMAMQYQAVTSIQTGTTTSMTYSSSNWNGSVLAGFKGSASGGPAAVSLTSPSLAFNSQAVGTTSAPQVVGLFNGTSATLSITGIAITGTNGGDYSQTNNCGTSLAAGASCSINVTFTPTAAGTRTASLTVTDNATNSPQTAGLTGTGTALPGLSPASLTFSSQNVGSSSAPETVTLTNYQSTALSITSIAITGTNSGDYSQTNNCGTSLAAGASCSINVTFTPAAAGTLTASLAVTDNATNSPQTAGLTGTGTALPSLSPASLTFSSQTVGTASPAQTLTLTNPQSAALSITSIAITGTNGGDYSQTNNCGTSLAAGASCSINVTFTPTAAGTLTASLAATDNATNSPQTAGLTGTGLGPAVTLSTSSVTFGKVGVGTTSSPQSDTLTNSGNATLNIASIIITGSNSSDFAQSNNCGSSVTPGANCSISITFTPSATGPRTATLSIADNATGSPQQVSLKGRGR